MDIVMTCHDIVLENQSNPGPAPLSRQTLPIFLEPGATLTDLTQLLHNMYGSTPLPTPFSTGPSHFSNRRSESAAKFRSAPRPLPEKEEETEQKRGDQEQEGGIGCCTVNARLFRFRSGLVCVCVCMVVCERHMFLFNEPRGDQ